MEAMGYDSVQKFMLLIRYIFGVKGGEDSHIPRYVCKLWVMAVFHSSGEGKANNGKGGRFGF